MSSSHFDVEDQYLRDWAGAPARCVRVCACVLGSEDAASPIPDSASQVCFLKASTLKSGCETGRVFLRGPILG